MPITESDREFRDAALRVICRIFAPPRERAPPLHRVQISPFGAALSAAARSRTATHRQLVPARARSRSRTLRQSPVCPGGHGHGHLAVPIDDPRVGRSRQRSGMRLPLKNNVGRGSS